MNNTLIKSLVIILILELAGLGLYTYLNRVTYVSNVSDINFSKDGNLAKDNPGYMPGVWYLVYDEPGSPASSVQLQFKNGLQPNFSVGDRVHVEGALKNSVVRVSNISNIDSDGKVKVVLYYYNPKLDQGPGGAQCGKKGLVPVERNIPKNNTPLKDTINLLLKGEITESEKNSGITTEFPLQGVSLTSADISNGIATLTFSDPKNKTGGGSCRVSLLWSQIEATAKQFPNIDSVKFVPKTLFQP